MEGKDNRHKQKRRNLKHFKKRHELKPDSAIQGIIESDVTDEDSDQHSGFGSKKLASNWSRYDEQSEDEAARFREDPNLLDFEALANQPTCMGDFFQFSSEKGWGLATEPDDPNEHPAMKECKKYFDINVNLLNAGLQTIPFYKRFDYDKFMFSEFDCRRMDAEAEIAETKYKALLQKDREAKAGNSSRAESATSSKKPKSAKPSPAPTPIPSLVKPAGDENDQELDELLNMTKEVNALSIQGNESSEAVPGIQAEPVDLPVEGGSVPTESEKLPNPESKEDIQQWLDDILDE